MTKRKEVPKIMKAVAAAPFVLKAAPGRTDSEDSSGIDTYHIRSRRTNTAIWIVPTMNGGVIPEEVKK